MNATGHGPIITDPEKLEEKTRRLGRLVYSIERID
jgi:hypothetical protein